MLKILGNSSDIYLASNTSCDPLIVYLFTLIDNIDVAKSAFA
ncbi:hypothetical protein OAF74_00305 [bacterium]|nr:hypothetical protein [bacterium]